jgi:hypothetical protein
MFKFTTPYCHPWQIMKFSIDYATVFYIEMYIKFWSEVLKERHNMEDPDIDGRII